MHHSKTPDPGTGAAITMLVVASATLIAIVIGGLYLLAQGAARFG